MAPAAMDEDCKIYLQAMEERLNAHADERLKASEERMAHLIANELGILHRDMQSGFARVDERFARIDDRLDRQGTMLVNLTRRSAACWRMSTESTPLIRNWLAR
jgi:hypothetical protein